jgi:hypothetical protein
MAICLAARNVSSGRRGADAGRVMWGVTSGERQPEALRGAEDTSLALLLSHAELPTDPAAILPASIQSLDDGLGRVFGGFLSARRALPPPLQIGRGMVCATCEGVRNSRRRKENQGILQ